jgi:hypothetical protein
VCAALARSAAINNEKGPGTPFPGLLYSFCLQAAVVT